jgi:hypothetical protein
MIILGKCNVVLIRLTERDSDKLRQLKSAIYGTGS